MLKVTLCVVLAFLSTVIMGLHIFHLYAQPAIVFRTGVDMSK